VTSIPARPGEAAGTHRDILEMDFREKKLYHQIHPLKLGTDIGVTPLTYLASISQRRAVGRGQSRSAGVVLARGSTYKPAAQSRPAAHKKGRCPLRFKETRREIVSLVGAFLLISLPPSRRHRRRRRIKSKSKSRDYAMTRAKQFATSSPPRQTSLRKGIRPLPMAHR
jgi:hypothetical protein